MDEELSKKTAMAMTSARPCDSCGARRACWFCAADAAYLCHACDTSVHTVNSLACRHNRLRLKLSAVRYHGGLLLVDGETSWPRKKTRSEWRRHNITLAPSLQSTESGCCTGSSKQNPDEAASTGGHPQLLLNCDSDLFRHEAVEDLNLASFRSRGSHGNDYLEMMSNNNENCEGSSSMGNGQPPPFIWPFDRVKIEESDDAGIEAEAGPEELFDLNIDLFDLTANFKDADHRMKVENCSYFNDEERKICLSLNYEDVLSAWSDRRSPWADPDDIKSSEGTRGTAYGVVPDLNLRSESCGDQIEEVPVMAAHDYDGERKYKSCGGREARVMRYREKRRRRLFSKRIRYHVRKLYAEKRQRMKGRFVKSACAGEVSLD